MDVTGRAKTSDMDVTLMRFIDKKELNGISFTTLMLKKQAAPETGGTVPFKAGDTKRASEFAVPRFQQ